MTNYEILKVSKKAGDRGEYITIPKKSKLFGKRYLKVVCVDDILTGEIYKQDHSYKPCRCEK